MCPLPWSPYGLNWDYYTKIPRRVAEDFWDSPSGLFLVAVTSVTALPERPAAQGAATGLCLFQSIESSSPVFPCG